MEQVQDASAGSTERSTAGAITSAGSRPSSATPASRPSSAAPAATSNQRPSSASTNNLAAALRAAQEAAAILKMREKRDKVQGKSAGWFVPRDPAQPYCGLHNEGATCYLNSLLQALFHLDEVRREVYAFEYGGEDVHGDKETCVPLQLAALFTRLQLSSCQATSTRALCTSFGWSRAEAFRQHDVQELCRVLFTALSKFGVPIETTLFEGCLTSTLRCLKCGHRSTRDEAFCDISLDVGAATSVGEALGAFTEWETLDGDNCWRCDVCNDR